VIFLLCSDIKTIKGTEKCVHHFIYAKLFPEAEYWIMLVVKQAGMQWQKTQTRKKPLSWISWTIY
jgi:hypothetical protein